MKIKVTQIGDPGPGDRPKSPVGVENKALSSQRTGGKASDQLDVRDAISSFIGSGVKDFSDPQRLKDFHYIQGVIGQEPARKLLTHVFLFNNRTDMAGKSPQERVQNFYDMPATDPDVDKMIKTYRNVDFRGPVSGLGTSGDYTNQQLSGRLPYIASGKIGR